MNDAFVRLGQGDTLEVDPTDWKNFMLKRIGEREAVFANALRKQRERAKAGAHRQRWARAAGLAMPLLSEGIARYASRPRGEQFVDSYDPDLDFQDVLSRQISNPTDFGYKW